jgi:hypothetical protein
VGEPDPTTQELRLQTLQRELKARGDAEAAPEPEEERTHERRAQRASYLQQKLEEREESEREA